MQLSKETIEELQKILKEDYGKNLSMSEASEVANTLVAYFDLLAEIYYRTKIKEEKAPKK